MALDMRELPDSAARHPEAARRTRDAEPTEQLELSVYLKPHSSEFHEAAVLQGRHETREQMQARRVSEHEDDIRQVTAFAAEHGLQVVRTEPERRLVRLSGSVAQFAAAFQADLGMYDAGEGEFRSYGGTLSVPENLAPRIESILGLDNRPAAEPHFMQHLEPGAITGHLPNAVGALYGFPASVNGAGRCIAVIELGGGYHDSDTAAAFAAMSLPVPTVVAVSVDGGTNSPGGNADGEVALDIQVAGGVAPGARLAVYFAPNTFQGFVDAVSAAAHDNTNKPSVISISWGTAELNWGTSAMASMTTAMQDAASLGVSVFVASGDYLAPDRVGDGKAHVDFPAASPWAIGCGGTTIDTSGSSISSEVVWNSGSTGTGGGISDYAAVPAFQAGTALPPSVNDGGHRRGVPDVSGDADPGSGYQIVLNGQNQQFGGTSAVAPLWAGLTARLNQMMPSPGTVGFFLPRLYGFPAGTGTRDITSGNNKPSSQPNLGYNAGSGWDACTGLGTPNGNMLAMILARTAKALGPAAAVEWVDSILHIRVYCQDQQNVIREFCWDNGWTVGATLPTAGPSSRLTAVQWSDGGGVHLRVYYQDTQNIIHEQCWDGSWQPGATLPSTAPGSSLAAVQWSDSGGVHLRVYFQDTQNVIREECYDGKWQPGAVLSAAAPGCGLAAVQWSDGGGVHLRVYYQDAQNIIREDCWDGRWQPGATLPSAAPGSGLAAVHWADSVQHLRVYYQDVQNVIREECFDGGWQPGATLLAAAPGSKLAAVRWADSTQHLRVYCNSSGNAVRESCFDGQWYTGQFVVPTM